MADEEPANINQAVATWARGRIGQQVGAGECWDLAEQALAASGGRLSGSFGEVTPNADYIWGTRITDLRQLRPGDIIQMRDFTETDTGTTAVTFADGSGWTEEGGSTSRGHHTVIVESQPDAQGRVSVLEQNYGTIGRRVQRNTIYTRDFDASPVTTRETRTRDDNGARETATVVRTVRIRTGGQLWAYRPIPAAAATP